MINVKETKTTSCQREHNIARM